MPDDERQQGNKSGESSGNKDQRITKKQLVKSLASGSRTLTDEDIIVSVAQARSLGLSRLRFGGGITQADKDLTDGVIWMDSDFSDGLARRMDMDPNDTMRRIDWDNSDPGT
jgi:hypothetical protein